MDNILFFRCNDKIILFANVFFKLNFWKFPPPYCQLLAEPHLWQLALYVDSPLALTPNCRVYSGKVWEIDKKCKLTGFRAGSWYETMSRDTIKYAMRPVQEFDFIKLVFVGFLLVSIALCHHQSSWVNCGSSGIMRNWGYHSATCGQ